jgi:uncharacterized oxidoreductase
MDLRNNTILITGGTSGLGFEFARQLLALGNTVLITGRDAARLAQTQRLLPQVHTFQSDVSAPAAIRQLYEQVTGQFPALNILINNAGEMRKLNLNDPALDLHDITREIDINLSGPIRMVQQFLPHLKAQPAAAILNVTSGLALTPFPLSPIYGATKSGLRSYTKSLRVQLKNSRVQVFELVAPAAKTPLGDQFATAMDTSSAMAADKLITAAIQGLRQGQPETYPGLAKALRFMSWLAPQFLLNQLSKPFEQEFGKQ